MLAQECTQRDACSAHIARVAPGNSAHLDLADGVQQVPETALHVQQARRLARVEHIDDEEAEVLLQPEDVVVGAVQHLERARVREDAAQRGAHVAAQREDVHDKVARACRHLHQTREALERPARRQCTLLAGGLGVRAGRAVVWGVGLWDMARLIEHGLIGAPGLVGRQPVHPWQLPLLCLILTGGGGTVYTRRLCFCQGNK